MEKKNYEKPVMLVVNLKNKPRLLSGSSFEGSGGEGGPQNNNSQ